MNNEKVIIESEFLLAGTLTIPLEQKKKYPAVLIIAGTGKTNRDGNDKKIQLNLYNDLANFLASHGFISLRYDKRGTHESGGDYYKTGVKDLIEDAAACVDFLKKDERVDAEKVIILGHSEGALLAPAVHAKSPVSGLILLAGAAEPSKDLLPKQFEMILNEIKETKGFKGWLFKILNVAKKAEKQHDKINEKIMNSNESVMKIKGTKVNAKWIREQNEYNVCDYLKRVECPTLSVTGDRDIQVDPEHAKKIAELVKGNAEWHIIPGMNHILRKYPGKHSMLQIMKEYKSVFEKPIDTDLYTCIEGWLDRNYLNL